MSGFNKIAYFLEEPFQKYQVHWRAQTVNNGQALALAYIDARDVMDRLDVVCRCDGWQSDHLDAGGGKLGCKIAIYSKDAQQWIWKSDGAGSTAVEGDKGAFSDAFKRAGVLWGIGRYLYGPAFKNIWVPCELKQNGKFKKFTQSPWEHVKDAPGPYKDEIAGPLGRSDLKKALKELVANLEAITDGDQLYPLLEDQESVITQCERDLPGWFFGKRGSDVLGLEDRIEKKKQECKE